MSNATQTYFNRHQGKWHWFVHIKIKSWKEFWQSNLSIFRKIQFISWLITQKVFGSYHLLTEVDFKTNEKKVYHQARFYKFGATWYKSQKVITLDNNGKDLKLEGNEYYWPLLNKGIVFQNYLGHVAECTTQAFYEMPLFGIKCAVNTLLNADQGTITFECNWMLVNCQLTKDSMANLRNRWQTNKTLNYR